MNDTQQTPPPGPGTERRFPTDQYADVRRLRRSATDRKLTGVCGGLGRHFDVDPTLFRVLIAVLVFFGGAGLFLYAALWLLVPDEATGKAIVSTGDDLLRWLLVGVLVIGGIMVLGVGGGIGMNQMQGMGDITTFGGNGLIGLVLTLLVLGGVAALLVVVLRRSPRSPQPPTFGPPPAGPAFSGQAGATSWSYGGPTPPGYAASPSAYAAPTAPPTWTPPPAPLPPRKTGPLLFWPTMAVLAIVLGAMGFIDAAAGASLAPGAYGAAATAVIGLALVVGAFVGRPGGLILAGLVALVSMGLGLAAGDTSSLESADSTVADVVPATAADLPERISFGTGAQTVDLTALDPAELDGRSLDVSGYAGSIRVLLPDGLAADVDAELSGMGRVALNDVDYNAGGMGITYDDSIGSTRPGAPTLDLELDLRFGEILLYAEGTTR